MATGSQHCHCCPWAPCYRERLHHSLTLKVGTQQHLGALSPFFATAVPLILTPAHATKLLPYLRLSWHYSSAGRSSLPAGEKDCHPSGLCPLLQYLCGWQWSLSGKSGCPGWGSFASSNKNSLKQAEALSQIIYSAYKMVEFGGFSCKKNISCSVRFMSSIWREGRGATSRTRVRESRDGKENVTLRRELRIDLCTFL